MTYLTTEVNHEPSEAFIEPGEEVSLRVTNSAAENGYEQEPGALTWLNSARVTADPDEDAVRFAVSVGDPRGAFVFTVRRLNDGTLVMHVPHPGDSCLHAPLTPLHEGTFRIGYEGAFADEESDDEEES